MTGAVRTRRKSLTDHVRDTLVGRIASDRLSPGTKLPTEREMIAEFGVSRTVIRDAIARLRAEGLVESRQGSGVYVRDPTAIQPRSETLETLSVIIETLEVRTAIEIEAARLAAARASPAQMAAIGERWDEMRHAHGPERAEAADLAFHLAIAAATNNSYFVDFFDFLGPRTIPRAQLRRLRDAPRSDEGYASLLLTEHKAIRNAIYARNPDAAGEAMRLHLKTSQDRYIRLIRSSVG